MKKINSLKINGLERMLEHLENGLTHIMIGSNTWAVTVALIAKYDQKIAELKDAIQSNERG